MTTFEATMKKINEEVALMDKLLKENASLKMEVSVLSSRVDQLEQYSRLNNVEIKGVPGKDNEKYPHHYSKKLVKV